MRVRMVPTPTECPGRWTAGALVIGKRAALEILLAELEELATENSCRLVYRTTSASRLRVIPAEPSGGP
jgi:hypothetical protein